MQKGYQVCQRHFYPVFLTFSSVFVLYWTRRAGGNPGRKEGKLCVYPHETTHPPAGSPAACTQPFPRLPGHHHHRQPRLLVGLPGQRFSEYRQKQNNVQLFMNLMEETARQFSLGGRGAAADRRTECQAGFAGSAE